MKSKTSLPILSFTVVSLLVLPMLHGQTDPASDPYKKPVQKSAPPLAATVESPVQVAVHEETFSLPIADAYALLHGSTNDSERYARVVKLMSEGKAALERMVVIRTKSGQRCVTESISEYRFPTEFGPAGFVPRRHPDRLADGTIRQPEVKATDPEIVHKDIIAASGPIPISFETRNVGDTLELEPVLGADGKTVDVNLVPQSVRFLKERAVGGPNQVFQPVFETQKLTTSITTEVGKPFLLGTLNRPHNNGVTTPEPEHRIWLNFLTCYAVKADGTAAPTSAPAMPVGAPAPSR